MTRRSGLARRLAAALMAPAILIGTALFASAPASADDAPGKLLLMLDASGSMNEKDPSGSTKITAAKRALTSVVGSLPDTAQVGLRVYGATQPGGKPTPAACADTQLVHPISTLDKPGLVKAINGFQAKGETPIAGSLTKAMADLGTEGKRNIVLVSDGEESCVPDPCPVIKQLVGSGIDLQIDTVGFGVNAKARTQLQCIADAGQGTYYDARNAQQLTTSLSKLAQRAARSFTVSGTPVVGTPAASGAPELMPGVYTDTLVTGASAKHYLLRRTIPHSTLRVAVTARPTVDLKRAYNQETIRFDGLDPDGGRCHNVWGMASRIGQSSMRLIVTDAVQFDGGSTADPAKCGGMEIPLTIQRDDGNADPAPIEILVMEEPPLSDAGGSLPTPQPKVTATPRAMGAARPVVGGSTFADAPAIGPGTWRETFVPGESILYRIPVGWGQGLEVTVPNLGIDETKMTVHFDSRIYSPDRGLAALGNLGYVTDTDIPPMARAIPPVAYQNREDYSIRNASLAGDYYLLIALPATTDGSSPLVPVTFRIDVTGATSTTPDYAEVTPTPPTTTATSPAGEATADRDSEASAEVPSTSSSLPIVGGALIAVAVLGGLIWAVIRRRANAGRSTT